VSKNSGGFRLVIDLKFLNQYFDYPTVQFESLQVLRYASKRITHMFSIDISDAYHHLMVHTDM
jgi:hypothetical protein